MYHPKFQRGITEEDDLLEQQAMLSKGSIAPAARVKRIGKSPGDTAQAPTTSSSQPPPLPEPAPKAAPIVGEILERAYTSQPLIPIVPTLPAGDSFPVPQNRKLSKFALSRGAKRDATGSAASTAPSDPRVSSSLGIQSLTPPASQVPPSAPAVPPPAPAPLDEIAAENARVLEAMTPEEIEQAQREILSRFRPEHVEFLKSLGAKQSGTAPQQAKRKAASRATLSSSPTTGPVAQASSARVAPKVDDKGRYKEDPSAKPPPPPSAATEDARGRQRSALEEQGAELVREFRRAVGLSSEVPSTSAEDLRAGPKRPTKNSSSSSSNPARSAVVLAERLRFDIEGRVLGVDEGAVPLGPGGLDPEHPEASPEERAALEGVLKRDLLRQSEGSVPQGYTLGEVLALIRSTFPNHRTAGLKILAQVIAQCRPGLLSDPTTDVLDGPSGVTRGAVWELLTSDGRFPLALRMALDDDQLKVAHGALHSLSALLAHCRDAEDLAREVEAAAPSPLGGAFALGYLTRTSLQDAWTSLLGVEYDRSLGRSRPASVIRAAGREMASEEPDPEEEGELSDLEVLARDPQAGLLRTGAVRRLGYLLEVLAPSVSSGDMASGAPSSSSPHALAVESCLRIITALAVGGEPAAILLAKDTGLLQGLTSVLRLADPAAQPSLCLAALQCTRALVEASEVVAKLMAREVLPVAAQPLLVALKHRGTARLSAVRIEALRLWRACALRSVFLCHVDDVFAQGLGQLVEAVGASEGYTTRAEAAEALRTLSALVAHAKSEYASAVPDNTQEPSGEAREEGRKGCPAMITAGCATAIVSMLLERVFTRSMAEELRDAVTSPSPSPVPSMVASALAMTAEVLGASGAATDFLLIQAASKAVLDFLGGAGPDAIISTATQAWEQRTLAVMQQPSTQQSSAVEAFRSQALAAASTVALLISITQALGVLGFIVPACASRLCALAWDVVSRVDALLSAFNHASSPALFRRLLAPVLTQQPGSPLVLRPYSLAAYQLLQSLVLSPAALLLACLSPPPRLGKDLCPPQASQPESIARAVRIAVSVVRLQGPGSERCALRCLEGLLEGLPLAVLFRATLTNAQARSTPFVAYLHEYDRSVGSVQAEADDELRLLVRGAQDLLEGYANAWLSLQMASGSLSRDGPGALRDCVQSVLTVFRTTDRDARTVGSLLGDASRLPLPEDWLLLETSSAEDIAGSLAAPTRQQQAFMEKAERALAVSLALVASCEDLGEVLLPPTRLLPALVNALVTGVTVAEPWRQPHCRRLGAHLLDACIAGGATKDGELMLSDGQARTLLERHAHVTFADPFSGWLVALTLSRLAPHRMVLAALQTLEENDPSRKLLLSLPPLTAFPEDLFTHSNLVQSNAPPSFLVPFVDQCVRALADPVCSMDQHWAKAADTAGARVVIDCVASALGAPESGPLVSTLGPSRVQMWRQILGPERTSWVLGYGATGGAPAAAGPRGRT